MEKYIESTTKTAMIRAARSMTKDEKLARLEVNITDAGDLKTRMGEYVDFKVNIESPLSMRLIYEFREPTTDDLVEEETHEWRLMLLDGNGVPVDSERVSYTDRSLPAQKQITEMVENLCGVQQRRFQNRDDLESLSAERKTDLLMSLLEDPDVNLIVWDEKSGQLFSTDKDTVCENGMNTVQIATVPM